jgi:YHS domain-containing protein
LLVASNQQAQHAFLLPPPIGDIAMKKIVTTSAMMGTLLLGLGTMAYAATGEFKNMCTEGLASHKIVHTNCSVHGTYNGKTYCFGNEAAKKEFFKNPSANLAKAEAFYKTNL